MNRPSLLLAINTGSSSLKANIYRFADPLEKAFSAKAEQIGAAGSRLEVAAADGQSAYQSAAGIKDHAAALGLLCGWLDESGQGQRLAAIGHRIVHGGPNLARPARIDNEVLAELRRAVPFAEHLPQAISAVEALVKAKRDVPQVACFDTAFHREMPPRARRLPIPVELAAAGVVRYGFHGLSYEYLVDRLRELDPTRAGGRCVLAHLGNGASMAAVDQGRPIDTSMAFTPTAGLVMGSRSGDLDPGVLVYLIQQQGLDPQAVNEFVNKRCGLMGLAGSSDMRELLAKRAADERAALAVEIFCYQAKKFLAAYAGALGGLDTLVFAGGIGEHAPEIRDEICRGLEFLGIRLDPPRNAAADAVISAPDASVVVRVIATDEDLMIARHTRDLLRSETTNA